MMNWFGIIALVLLGVLVIDCIAVLFGYWLHKSREKEEKHGSSTED